MTGSFDRMMFRAATIALSAAALGACADMHPQYPVTMDNAPPIATAPAPAPVKPPPAETPPPPPPPSVPAPESEPAPAPPPISSQPLPPPNREPPPPPPPRPPPVVVAPAPPPPPVVHYTVEGPVRPQEEDTRKVTVEAGDTVNNLAERFHATKDAIIKANKLKKPYELEVGQSLKIPTPKAYTVQHGDTLFSVSHRFSTPPEVLAELNDLEKGERLHTGQKIALPLEFKDIGPIPVKGPAPESEAGRPTRPSESYSAPSNAQPYRAPTPTYIAPPPAEPTPSLTDAQVAAAGKGLFTWPVQGETITTFGPKPGGQKSDGLIIAAALGTPVQAAAAGDVVYVGNSLPGFGNLVLIRHDAGWVTVYAHLSRTQVKIKDHVGQGDVIGEVGQSGGVDQPELYFEIRYTPAAREKPKPIDPSLVLTK